MIWQREEEEGVGNCSGVGESLGWESMGLEEGAQSMGSGLEREYDAPNMRGKRTATGRAQRQTGKARWEVGKALTAAPPAQAQAPSTKHTHKQSTSTPSSTAAAVSSGRRQWQQHQQQHQAEPAAAAAMMMMMMMMGPTWHLWLPVAVALWQPRGRRQPGQDIISNRPSLVCRVSFYSASRDCSCC